MSPWSRFPFVRITIALVGGILLAHYSERDAWVVAGSLLGLLLLIYLFVMRGVPYIRFFMRSPWLGFLGLGSIFLLGYLRYLSYDVHYDPKHLIHLTHEAAPIEAYEAIVLEDAHAKNGRGSVVVAVRSARIQGKWQPVHGKVQVSWHHQTKIPPLYYGNMVLIQGQPWEVHNANNPYAFDYAKFLRLSKIYHQHFVAGEKVVVVDHRPPSFIKKLAFRVLRYCKSLFTQHIHHTQARAVALALILGQRDALTAEVSDTYVRAGAMHVLAVSGLHVGIIYWILCFLLVPLKYVGRFRLLSSGIAILVLWFYTFITGLSPSVLRATTMFTLMVVAPVLSRQTSSYNILAASAFLLLCWEPMLLFSVGFQLSYLAVLGILYLQPRIYRLLTLNNWLFDKLWLLTSVSLGAQIGTAPLSVYYFLQFPTYFIIANWVVVPAALVIVCLGILVLITGLWSDVSAAIAWLLEKVVLSINVWLEFTQKLPYSLVAPISVSIAEVCLLYGLLVLLLIFLYTKHMRYLIAMSILAMLMALHISQVSLSQQAQCKVIFYSIGRHRVISFVKGKHSTLCTDKHFKIDSPEYTYHVQPSYTALGITSSTTHVLAEAMQQQEFPMQLWHGMKVVVWKGKTFIFLDQESKALPQLAKKLSIDFLVVEENSFTTLQPLLACFDFGTLVIGASNNATLSKKLQEEAVKHGVYSHALRPQGALIVSW
ncbi:MAG: ComEC/Rec2 family competence protein [Bacteroidota bacterium]